ncbi:hypothetical protein EKH57_15675 [Halorubrum sp. BOL3-1]|nr:hypothetical protein EKH57_15675 [Halorubrum sp. BOL3-1]
MTTISPSGPSSRSWRLITRCHYPNERYYRVLEVLQTLDGAMTVNELAAEPKIDTGEVRDRVAYLVMLDRIRRDDGTVRPRE